MIKNKFLFLIVLLIIFGGYYFIYSPRIDDVEVLQKDNKDDLIIVEGPKVGDIVKSPLYIFGQARGYWFFEASFPVFLTDSSGTVISQGIATAKSEWMTTEFVPFEAVLEFEKPASAKRGVLILKKDNPSGLPEHDDQVEIPVIF